MNEQSISGRDVLRLITNNDWPAILQLLELGTLKPNQKIVVQMIAYQHTLFLLPAAVNQKAHTAIKALLAKGANPNQRYEGETPLTVACENRDHETIELLLNAKADL